MLGSGSGCGAARAGGSGGGAPSWRFEDVGLAFQQLTATEAKAGLVQEYLDWRLGEHYARTQRAAWRALLGGDAADDSAFGPRAVARDTARRAETAKQSALVEKTEQARVAAT